MAEFDHIERSPVSAQEHLVANLGALRRMGESGPMYEVLDIIDRDTIEIRVIGSDERALYPVACFLADPED